MNHKEIDSFFNFFKNIKRENPYFKFNSNQVYRILTRFNTINNFDLLQGKEENNELIYKTGSFSRLFEKFALYHNSKPFFDGYFLHFLKDYENIKNNEEFIKIYIPLDINHIETGTDKILNFLNYYNIKHMSKIGKDIRFDDLVVRVTNKEDADKLLEFIKNDRYIQEGLIKANPFAFTKNNVALVCDGRTSYNSILSDILTDFINNIKPEYLNSNNFYNYLKNFYNKLYNTKEIDEKTYILSKNEDHIPSSKDFKRILELIIKSYNPNFNYENYINHFNEGFSKNNENIDDILYDILTTMSEKYGIEDSIIMTKNFIEQNNYQYLTRYKNLRNNISRTNFRNNLLKFLNDNNIGFTNYCSFVLNNHLSKEKSR